MTFKIFYHRENHKFEKQGTTQILTHNKYQLQHCVLL